MSPSSRPRGDPRRSLPLVVLLLVFFITGHASAQGVPDPCQSEVEVFCNNIIFVPPWGYGDSLGDLGLLITVRDEFGIPIPGIPAFDFEVLDDGGAYGLYLTDASEIASEVTDPEGRIVLTRRLQGMGHAIGMPLRIEVTANASVITLDCNPLPSATFVSPDINGDGAVNLLDLTFFAPCYLGGGYCIEIDFNGDGEIGFADLVIFQRYYGWMMKEGERSQKPVTQTFPESTKNGTGLFVGCLQLDFDDDDDPDTITDSLLVTPMVPATVKIVARDFRALSGVNLSLLLPPGLTLFPGGCITAEPPFSLGPGGGDDCGTTALLDEPLALTNPPCLDSGPVFVAEVTIWSTTTGGWFFTDDFALSGELSDCLPRPNVVEACIGSPTPCQVSTLEVEVGSFLTCPGGDADIDETMTLTLRDQDGAGVAGIAATELTVSIFDERGSNEGDRFRLTPLATETDQNGELLYLFEPRESCRWDGCFDLLITAQLEGCELTVNKRVRTFNLVRYEDDPAGGDFDEINLNDVAYFASIVATLDDCGDFFGLYRCPLVHPANIQYLQNHLGHSCSVTSAPDLPPARWSALEQNVPNPFNPRTRLTVQLTHPSENATLEVYTLDGRFVRRIWEGPLPAGDSPFHWDGKDTQSRSVSSGVYLARLVTERHRESIRMVLLR